MRPPAPRPQDALRVTGCSPPVCDGPVRTVKVLFSVGVATLAELALFESLSGAKLAQTRVKLTELESLQERN